MHQIKAPWAKVSGRHFFLGDLVETASGVKGRIDRFLDDVEVHIYLSFYSHAFRVLKKMRVLCVRKC